MKRKNANRFLGPSPTNAANPPRATPGNLAIPPRRFCLPTRLLRPGSAIGRSANPSIRIARGLWAPSEKRITLAKGAEVEEDQAPPFRPDSPSREEGILWAPSLASV